MPQARYAESVCPQALDRSCKQTFTGLDHRCTQNYASFPTPSPFVGTYYGNDPYFRKSTMEKKVPCVLWE